MLAIPRNLALMGVMSLLLAGCNGDGGGGPMDPAGEDIRGTYPGAWIFRVIEVSTGLTVEFQCPGSMTIASQSGSSLGGTFRVSETEDCDQINGTLEGTTSNGTLHVQLDPDPFEGDLEGCTIIMRDDELVGEVAGTNLSLEGSVTADCEGVEGVIRIRITLGYQGTRPG